MNTGAYKLDILKVIQNTHKAIYKSSFSLTKHQTSK